MADLSVLITDGLEPSGIKIFSNAGFYIEDKKIKQADLPEAVRFFDALVVRSKTQVDASVIEKGEMLKVIGRSGNGVDNILIDEATKKNILVMNTPAATTNTVAEYAFTQMLNLAKMIPQAHHEMAAGNWVDKKKYEGSEIYGKTLGIIGCGKIGQRLAEMASSPAFGIKVIGYDTSSQTEYQHIEKVCLDDLLRKSDYISIHTGGKETIIGEKQIAMMEKHPYIINCSRGKNVEPEALRSALKSEYLKGAALDVFVKEESNYENFFGELNNVILTPHIAGNTKEGRIRASEMIAQNIVNYLLHNKVVGAVNEIKNYAA